MSPYVSEIHKATKTNILISGLLVNRREYKKRFSRIRTGRTTKEQFYAWSEQAREKKEACETGKLPRVEFIEWLKEEEV